MKKKLHSRRKGRIIDVDHEIKPYYLGIIDFSTWRRNRGVVRMFLLMIMFGIVRAYTLMNYHCCYEFFFLGIHM